MYNYDRVPEDKTCETKSYQVFRMACTEIKYII